MSKNFELLTRLGEQQTLIQPESATVKAAPDLSAVPRAQTNNTELSASEEEIKLVQRVFLVPGQEAPKSVVICGIDERDGSSPMCARISEILASRLNGEVCLVDADFYSPSLHRRYSLENTLGMTDAVFEPGLAKGFAQRIGEGNLWVLSAGSRTAQGAGILSPERLRERLGELRQQFAYVLVSAPPINLYPDALVFGRLVDGIVLVLKANSTRRAAALKVKQNLEVSNVRLLGAVLTERTFPIPDVVYRNL